MTNQEPKQSKKPGPLTEAQKENFETLCKAIRNGDVCLISAIEKATKKERALICAVNRESDDYQFVPFAVMVWGNPYEMFEDPTAE